METQTIEKSIKDEEKGTEAKLKKADVAIEKAKAEMKSNPEEKVSGKKVETKKVNGKKKEKPKYNYSTYTSRLPISYTVELHKKLIEIAKKRNVKLGVLYVEAITQLIKKS